MEWFRWYHDTASDAKFGVVARRSGQHKSLVVAVWASLLEYASKQDDRGTLSNIDIEEVAEALDLDMEPVEAIIKAFTDKNMIIESRIANWEKRQPASRLTPWQKLRLHVFERDNYTCQYCGLKAKKLECDHIHPIARGGFDDIDNLLTACRQCNRQKGAKTLDEWRGKNALV